MTVTDMLGFDAGIDRTLSIGKEDHLKKGFGDLKSFENVPNFWVHWVHWVQVGYKLGTFYGRNYNIKH